MSFKSLYKLFVMSKYDDFMKIYNEKFNSSASVKLDIYIHDYQAFFTYDKEIMSKLALIKELDIRINNILQTLPDIALKQYMRKSLIDEIEYTNQIEGVVSTRKEIQDLINEIEKKLKTKNRFLGIVNKYMLLSKEELSFKCSKDVRKLYDDMLYEEIKTEDEENLPDGEVFRKNIVNVYKSSQNVHSGLMPESKIIEYMDKSLNVLNDSNIDVLIRVAIFHYLFGYIHPFYDGNGRVNRFISSYYLSRYYNKSIGFRLSMTIKENINQYLDAFKETNDVRNRADLSTFIFVFLDIIFKSLEQTEVYLLEKRKEIEELSEYINGQEMLDNNQKKLLTFLNINNIFGGNGLSKVDLQEMLGKKQTTVTNCLSVLKKLDSIEEINSGRYIYYIVKK